MQFSLCQAKESFRPSLSKTVPLAGSRSTRECEQADKIMSRKIETAEIMEQHFGLVALEEYQAPWFEARGLVSELANLSV
jgi:hypothetical protein